MKAFWWFEQDLIAGMARPGFNCTRWFDFPFDQAILVGWLGQHSSGSTMLEDLQKHVQEYGSKIYRFYQMDAQAAHHQLESLKEPSNILKTLERLSNESQILEHFDFHDGELHFEFSKSRLELELSYLKSQGIRKIVSLTERHHQKGNLEMHFDTFHFSIPDLDAPTLDQVHHLAAILKDSRYSKTKVAVHCLAGIGRTSTMLMAAHMVLGETLEDMKIRIARQNPVFTFAGRQAEFLTTLSEKLGNHA